MNRSERHGRESVYPATKHFVPEYDSRPRSDYGQNYFWDLDEADEESKSNPRADARIRADVIEALHEVDSFHRSRIDVTVKEGVVTLSGSVRSLASKQAATALVDPVPGVRDVKNLLHLS